MKEAGSGNMPSRTNPPQTSLSAGTVAKRVTCSMSVKLKTACIVGNQTTSPTNATISLMVLLAGEAEQEAGVPQHSGVMVPEQEGAVAAEPEGAGLILLPIRNYMIILNGMMKQKPIFFMVGTHLHHQDLVVLQFPCHPPWCLRLHAFNPVSAKCHHISGYWIVVQRTTSPP